MKRLVPLLAACAVACADAASRETTTTPPIDATDVAIVNVNVVPMDAERILSAHTVLIHDGRVVTIAPSSAVTVPAGATTIDGNNGYLLPGLIDMHVHILAEDLPAYLRYGVTTVRNMWGFNELPRIIDEVARGTRSGPQIFSLTAGFDGSPAVWPQTQISDDVRAIPSLIDRQQQLGFREIKVYQKLSRPAYDTIVAEARRRNMTFAGHTPPSVGVLLAVAAGQRSLEHLGGFGDGADLSRQVAAVAAAGTYICPTLTIQSMMSPSAWTEARRNIVRALHQGGARILAGSDSGIGRTQPGISIHQELEQLVLAGMDPYDALLGATRLAAEYLGQSNRLGVIKPGAEADLLLVRSNPLRNITATQAVEAVFVNGVPVSPN